MADVSVIIPSYNRGQRLRRAIGSVLNQRLQVREILVVDDGSTDESGRIVEEFRRCADIPLISCRQPNQGPAAARNLGISRASGEFVAFLDSDDEWHRDKILLQYPEMLAASSFLVSHTRERWLKNGRHLNQKNIHQPQHGDIFEQSLKLCCVGMSTVMARKGLFERYGMFDESLRCCEDYDLWLRVAAFEPFLLVERRLTVKHGGRSDQVSRRYRVGMDRFRIQALGRLIETVPIPEDRRSAARAELIRRCEIYRRGCMKHSRQSEAVFYRKLAERFFRISEYR
ncbi:MAG: glycosyltransferase family 2 protein [Desulfofustis sp.]|jgi:glycosyltransferase involved in cell wall biosynthesis|nr:glycosyltransferase family 2 protein [Desulfofustis sp.]